MKYLCIMYIEVGGMIELYPRGVNKSKDLATQQNKQEHICGCAIVSKKNPMKKNINVAISQNLYSIFRNYHKMFDV